MKIQYKNSGTLHDPLDIPKIIIEVYLDGGDFQNVYERYVRAIAFEPIPRKDKKFQTMDEEYK